MPKHDYTPKEALDLLVGKVQELSPQLASRIRLAIDAGKDDQVADTIKGGVAKRKAKMRVYRKHRPYTDEEAVSLAVSVLESHLVESRMLVNASCVEFQKISLGSPKRPKPAGFPGDRWRTKMDLDSDIADVVGEVLGADQPRYLAVEREPESVQQKENLPSVSFVPVEEQLLISLRELFEVLKSLVDFKEASSGNAH